MAKEKYLIHQMSPPFDIYLSRFTSLLLSSLSSSSACFCISMQRRKGGGSMGVGLATLYLITHS